MKRRMETWYTWETTSVNDKGKTVTTAESGPTIPTGAENVKPLKVAVYRSKDQR